jgi:hypothetical protein
VLQSKDSGKAANAKLRNQQEAFRTIARAHEGRQPVAVFCASPLFVGFAFFLARPLGAEAFGDGLGAVACEVV